jgi:NADPH-dependent 2,4-dienoyl-CoA reductase/sulfur reductase-like enzyme
MWMAWDRFQRTKRGTNIEVEFWTGMPTMFSVPKYSDALNALRQERKIRGEFQHNLVSIDSSKRIATFAKPDGTKVETDYTMLHVTPPMGPLEFIKKSPLADGAGWVDVNQGTLRHNKEEYGNVFSLGDCSSLPTSKTAAAITSQAPVLTENVFSVMNSGKVNPAAVYDGYTSCPVSTHSAVLFRVTHTNCSY